MKLSNIILVYLVDGPKCFNEIVNLVSDFIDPAQAVRAVRHVNPNGSQEEIEQGKSRRVKMTIASMIQDGWIDFAEGKYAMCNGVLERIRKSSPLPGTSIGQKAGNFMKVIEKLWIQGRIEISISINKQ